MRMEQQLGGFENNRLEVTNQMQMQLASMHGEEMGYFIDKRAEGFRSLIDAHPEFLEQFEKEPQTTLKKIEPLLYH